jgi:thymidylate synthase ThyX
MNDTSRRRVITVAPMPPEKIAYALARYSRSPDSIRESIDWVRTHDSAKFLESFYFQYGHASIADLGHLVICLEGISELAATEIEDEQLWDGQARSSRYQDFGRTGFVTPADFDAEQSAAYKAAGERLLEAYRSTHEATVRYLGQKLPRPGSMKPEAYARNIAARAFDIARYCLFFGIPTGVGQVVSIRTLERQIRRMRASEYGELADLGVEIAEACRQSPVCEWGDNASEPLAPTLAKYVDADTHQAQARRDLALWAQACLPPASEWDGNDVDVLRPSNTAADIAATLLYPVTDRPFRQLYETACSWGTGRCMEVIDTALRSRSRRDDLLREFRTATFAFDMVMDIGAWRDLHRHRRCQQFRQAYTTRLGYAVPPDVVSAGLEEQYRSAIESAHRTAERLPQPGRAYLLPFGTRARFLFKMDFAEAEYISRLRSGVKGHFSYREIAWKMKEKLAGIEPELAKLIQATPPWEEDPLQR